MVIELLYLETNVCSFAIVEVSALSGSHTIASLSPTRASTPEFLTEIQRISLLTTASFNAWNGAFSSESEGGGEFEYRVFVYLQLIVNREVLCYMSPLCENFLCWKIKKLTFFFNWEVSGNFFKAGWEFIIQLHHSGQSKYHFQFFWYHIIDFLIDPGGTRIKKYFVKLQLGGEEAFSLDHKSLEYLGHNADLYYIFKTMKSCNQNKF